jgi:hypothetical protein
MKDADTVTVYSFRQFDGSYELPRVSAFKATRDVVEHVHHGEVLEGTAEEVSVDELDGNGRFVRLASGWAALG